MSNYSGHRDFTIIEKNLFSKKRSVERYSSFCRTTSIEEFIFFIVDEASMIPISCRFQNCSLRRVPF